MTVLSLEPGRFDAVHCRIGHPAFRNSGRYQQQDKRQDLNGRFRFRGYAKTEAIDAAIRGIQCVRQLAAAQSNEVMKEDPVYFYADAPALVELVVNPWARFDVATEEDDRNSEAFEQLKFLRATTKVTGRTNASVVHLETKRTDVDFEAFVSTFVDLYVASQARCISFGVGRFGYFAAQISKRNGDRACWSRHQAPDPDVSRR
eukprot:CAMPEP_0176002200 /NCGR_PEP_ID=MMETSP0120_2-20121206/523_1 /TAXON_ID=160619 /ORGANISM="Kryptoperidinium foliaceum, Strain CCMP 1326" /LENGTH=202 /DNA_ID=CAMNT_0017334779 /DNA_START=95 /DNA_END=699 /DNA_ORIENTATION=+